MTVLKEYKGSGSVSDPANWETIFVGTGPVGPPGPPGATGSRGPQGTVGLTGPPPPTISLTRAQWQALSPPDPNTIYIITDEGGVMLSGTAAPAAGLGFNGDFYLDSVTWLIYGPKTATGWGVGTPLQAKWTRMTQAAYNALPTKDPQTLYVIVG
jgi:hypothetical protein